MYEFTKTNSVYVGITWNIKERQSRHRKNPSSAVYKHSKKHNISDNDYAFSIIGYYDMNIAGEIEQKIEQEYKDRGWNILNVAKCGGMGGSIKKWTYNRCKKEALKYNTKTEFIKSNASAYNSAIHNGWLDEITTHMKRLVRKPWSYEECRKIAFKYKRRCDFKKGSSGAYSTAYRNKWLDDFFPKK